MKTPRQDPRPLPSPSLSTQPFWEAAKKGKFALQYDPQSRRYQFWPRAHSVRTGKRNLKWRNASGKGSLYSYTETHVPAPGFEGRAPYLLGLVELDEKVRVIGPLVDIDAADIVIGMRLKVAFETLSDDVRYYAFTAA